MPIANVISFCESGEPPDLHSFPTRRSSDLSAAARRDSRRRRGRGGDRAGRLRAIGPREDRKSTRLNSSHPSISYAVFCLKKKKSVSTPPKPLPKAAHVNTVLIAVFRSRPDI